jgi:hypothetical protein
VRRRFVDAARVQPKGKRGHADEAVALIGKLYGIEREYKNADDATRLLARQQLSVVSQFDVPMFTHGDGWQ